MKQRLKAAPATQRISGGMHEDLDWIVGMAALGSVMALQIPRQERRE
jgi:hypothetical protein